MFNKKILYTWCVIYVIVATTLIWRMVDITLSYNRCEIMEVKFAELHKIMETVTWE